MERHTNAVWRSGAIERQEALGEILLAQRYSYNNIADCGRTKRHININLSHGRIYSVKPVTFSLLINSVAGGFYCMQTDGDNESELQVKYRF